MGDLQRENQAKSMPDDENRSVSPDLEATVLGPQDTEANLSSSGKVVDMSWVGKSLGKFKVTQLLGQGGMGVVLKAHDSVIGRDVAIKVLANEVATDATALKRFLGEAKAVGQINHPNVSGLYDVGREGDIQFLVMEFVPGGSVAEHLERQGKLSVLEATQVMVEACQGIGAAHAAGLIHRDIKPANFLMTDDGTVKVTDFGLAKAVSVQNLQLTQVGIVVGTPFFMSPEQCQGSSIDSRSDVYSLGATYYSLLTGKNPYHDSTSIQQVMYAHCHGGIPDPRTEDESIPLVCTRIIAKAMAKSPEDRYQSVKAMLTDLDMVRATLSGQTLNALPSESGNVAPHTVPDRSLPDRSSGPRKLTAWVAGISAVLIVLLAIIVMQWQPWRQTNEQLPPSQLAASPTGEPIRIGILHSLSGTMAENETVVVDAMMFAIEEINRSGGVLGRSIKPIVADGRSDPEVFAREAERLIVDEKVTTIFGCWTSASRKTVKSIVEEYDHLLVYPLQYEGLETAPNIIYLGASPNQQILPAIEWAYNSLGKRRFFLLGSDYVFPRVANAIIKDRLKSLGADVVGEKYLNLGSTEVAETVAAIAESSPDIILNTINGDTNIALFRALRKAGISSDQCPTLSFSTTEAGLRNLNPDHIVGDYMAWTYFEAVDTPDNKKFVERFQEKYPQRIVTDPMESAYVAVHLWALAVQEAQSIEPRRIRHLMLEQRFSSPEGEIRIDVDTQHTYKTPRIGQIQPDGRVKIAWTASKSVKPNPFPESRTATEWLAYLHDLYAGWGNRWSAP